MPQVLPCDIHICKTSLQSERVCHSRHRHTHHTAHITHHTHSYIHHIIHHIKAFYVGLFCAAYTYNSAMAVCTFVVPYFVASFALMEVGHHPHTSIHITSHYTSHITIHHTFHHFTSHHMTWHHISHHTLHHITHTCTHA